MELTSEVERIMSGTLVMTDKPLKAIQVSETTIKPNASGIVPLSKQDALKVLPISSVPPVLEDPKISDVVEEVPIEVASPESLESFSVNLNTPPEKDQSVPAETPIPEETPIEINLPEMQPVVAQEPTAINDSLFIDSAPTKDNNTLESPVETSQTQALESTQKLDNPLDTSVADGFLVPDLMFNSEDKNSETLEEPKQEVNLNLDTSSEIVSTNTPALTEETKVSSKLQFTNEEEINKYVNKFIEDMKKDFDSKIEIFKNNILELMQNKNISTEVPTIPTVQEDETINALDFISTAPELKTEGNTSSPTIPDVPLLDSNNVQKMENSFELPTIDEVKSNESNDDMQIKGMFI